MTGLYVGLQAQIALCEELLEAAKTILKEPASEELEQAAEEFCEGEWDGLHDKDGEPLYTSDYLEYTFKAGAQWQKEQIMKDALPAVVKEAKVAKNAYVITSYVLFDGKYTKDSRIKMIVIPSDNKND